MTYQGYLKIAHRCCVEFNALFLYSLTVLVIFFVFFLEIYRSKQVVFVSLFQSK